MYRKVPGLAHMQADKWCNLSRWPKNSALLILLGLGNIYISHQHENYGTILPSMKHPHARVAISMSDMPSTQIRQGHPGTHMGIASIAISMSDMPRTQIRQGHAGTHMGIASIIYINKRLSTFGRHRGRVWVKNRGLFIIEQTYSEG